MFSSQRLRPKRKFFFKQTLSIFLINVIVFFCLLFISRISSDIPLYFATWNYESGLFAPYQLVSYQFIHADLNHLLLNLLIFLPTSLYLESFLRVKIFYYFLICGIIGGLLHLLLYNQDLPLVGASGSIWGLSVILALVERSILLKTFVILQFIVEFYRATDGLHDGVAHWCHIGGALGGLLIFFFERNSLKNQLR